jgi:hypothetical protein
MERIWECSDGADLLDHLVKLRFGELQTRKRAGGQSVVCRARGCRLHVFLIRGEEFHCSFVEPRCHCLKHPIALCFIE